MPTPVSGLYVGANGRVYDATAYARGQDADTGLTADIHRYALNSGLFVGQDGQIYDLPTLMQGMSAQLGEMPEASESMLGRVIQYVGETDETYTNGRFYTCVADGGGYAWTEISTEINVHVSGTGIIF